MRWQYFDESDAPHPEDCPCGNGRGFDGQDHSVKVHNGVCFVANVGANVQDLGKLGVDWEKMTRLAFAPGTNEHEFKVKTWKLPDNPAEHYRALRISECRPWCCLHGRDIDHTWCIPFDNVNGFYGGAGI